MDVIAPIDRRRFLIGASAMPVGGACVAAAAPPIGAVMTATGSAFLQRDAGRITAAAGAPLLLDDLALTGDDSRLDMRIGRATRIKLGSRSSLKINRFVAGVRDDVELLDGPAFINYAPGAEPFLSVISPYALIAARGTSFFAGPSNGVFGVFVRQGRVDVRTRAGTVRLGPGEGTDIAVPGAPPTAPKRWAPPRIAAALASVS